MIKRTHTHPCATCGATVECPGTYERNHDGWPEAVCDVYHRHAPFQCEDCADTTTCADCDGYGEVERQGTDDAAPCPTCGGTGVHPAAREESKRQLS